MPHEVSLKGPIYTFQCYGMHEAKQLGIVDSFGREGTHAPVSTIFDQGEGKILADWLETLPDALLISVSRYQILVYRPKSKVLSVDEDPAEPQSHLRIVQDSDGDAVSDGALPEADRDDANIVPFMQGEVAA